MPCREKVSRSRLGRMFSWPTLPVKPPAASSRPAIRTVLMALIASIDGEDVLRLKVTLKNGDIVYYYLDPDTFLEIRTERQEFVRGSVRESVTDLGSYKKVGGLMYPFSVASGPKNDPSSWQSVTMEKIEVNVPLGNS